jgi:hypothetical protein
MHHLGPAMFLLYHSDRCNTSETVFHWCYVNGLHTTHAVVCWVTIRGAKEIFIGSAYKVVAVERVNATEGPWILCALGRCGTEGPLCRVIEFPHLKRGGGAWPPYLRNLLKGASNIYAKF